MKATKWCVLSRTLTHTQHAAHNTQLPQIPQSADVQVRKCLPGGNGEMVQTVAGSDTSQPKRGTQDAAGKRVRRREEKRPQGCKAKRERAVATAWMGWTIRIRDQRMRPSTSTGVESGRGDRDNISSPSNPSTPKSEAGPSRTKQDQARTRPSRRPVLPGLDN